LNAASFRRLVAHRKKIFGLTIAPERLVRFATSRPNSRYASLDNTAWSERG
jgi:regulator of PEP synthase PpsR (kinase-PPPase family)